MSETFKNFRYALVGMLLLFCAAVQAQTISGNVKDAAGEPIIGATVMEQGTQNGTVTDFDGNFTLKLQKGGNLNISYVGMKSQVVKTAGKSSVNVVLEDDNTTLNDLVVVGYGTMKKSDLTGSVSSVNTEQLNAKGAADVMGNLQGATPGVNITQSSGRAGGDFDIEIRGKSSINSDTKPLYVVDGVMCDDINWLNPQDIEKIDILKDASSTAIYGSRATAGVVMVTTKAGTNVKKDTKATISYDGYFGWSKVVRMPEFMDGQQFYNYRFLKFLEYSRPTQVQSNPATPYYAMKTLAQALLYGGEKGEETYKLKDMLASGETYDWPKAVTQNGQQQNHYLSVSGSGDKINYHFGFGYNQQEGTYKGDKQNRINFKGSLDAKINKLITAGFSFNMARQFNEYAYDDAIRIAYRMNPFMKPYNEDGSIRLFPGNKESVGTVPSSSYQFSDQYNPLAYMNNYVHERETWRMLGNFYLKFDFMKGLDFKTTFSPNYTYYRDGSHEGIENPNDPGHVWHENSKAYSTEIPMTDDYTWATSNYTTNRAFSYTWDNVLTFNRTFKEIHSVNLMGLFSIQHNNTEKLTWVGTNNALLGSNWWAMQNAAYSKDDSSTAYAENNMLSWAFRANYGYKNRYLLTATIRWDGSSKFAKDKRWGSFPSVALAWRVTEEEFMKQYEWLSNLKLRVSYGVTGNNAGVGNYDTAVYPSRYTIYPINGVYQTAYVPNIIPNPELKWEKSGEFNVGIDYGFLNNRIMGSIDFYTKKSKDLLYNVTLPLETGLNTSGTYYTMTKNIGSVRNTGIEFSVTTVNVKTKDWNWQTTINFSHNKNEVLEINGLSDEYIDGSNPVTNSLKVGHSVNDAWVYTSDGIVSDRLMTVPDNQAATSKGFTPGEQVREYDYYYKVYGWKEGQPIIRDTNGDGVISTADREWKRTDPTWTGSLTSNLSWKNWDFSFNLYTKLGAYVYSNFINEYADWSDRGRNRLNMDYYIPAGALLDCDGVMDDGIYINPVYQQTTKYGDYPFPNFGGDGSGVGVNASEWNEARSFVNASFLKVKNITLGYTFPRSWLTPWGCSYLRLYFTVTNPIVFSSYKGFDPEWAGASLKNDGPSTVTYQVGASIKF